MSKKIYVPLVLALVAVLAFSGVAFAKGLPKGDVRRIGEVISVDKAANTFKFDTQTGVRYTIHVTSGTTYMGISGLSALKADDRLNLEVKRLSDGAWTAERVKLIPDVNENEVIESMREHGVVIGIGASSFTIRNSNNQVFTFQVVTKTRFSGRDVPHFRELKLGMHVTVNFRKDGKLMDARTVLVTGR